MTVLTESHAGIESDPQNDASPGERDDLQHRPTEISSAPQYTDLQKWQIAYKMQIAAVEVTQQQLLARFDANPEIFLNEEQMGVYRELVERKNLLQKWIGVIARLDTVQKALTGLMSQARPAEEAKAAQFERMPECFMIKKNAAAYASLRNEEAGLIATIGQYPASMPEDAGELESEFQMANSQLSLLVGEAKMAIQKDYNHVTQFGAPAPTFEKLDSQEAPPEKALLGTMSAMCAEACRCALIAEMFDPDVKEKSSLLKNATSSDTQPPRSRARKRAPKQPVTA